MFRSLNFGSGRDLQKIQVLPKASNSLETQGAAMGERQGLALAGTPACGLG
jgi:hypothetical protein